MFEIGIDIVSVWRVRENIEQYGKAYLEKIFLPAEIEYCSGKAKPEIHFAGMFAAKEAVWKALKLPGNGPVLWNQIEISHTPDNAPAVILHHKIDKLRSPPFEGTLTLSVSHCDEYAVGAALAIYSLQFREYFNKR